MQILQADVLAEYWRELDASSHPAQACRDHAVRLVSPVRFGSSPLGERHWMRIYAPLFGLSLVIGASAQAGPADQAAAAASKIVDSFNRGNTRAFFTAHEDGALIVDELPPYVWRGHKSAERWAADYDTDAKVRRISAGRVDLQKPIQAVSDGRSAYIVFPSTYTFVQKGKKMAGRGSMTFVMRRHGADWKIASWTYSGATPSPE
jgi:hypothetical protein